MAILFPASLGPAPWSALNSAPARAGAPCHDSTHLKFALFGLTPDVCLQVRLPKYILCTRFVLLQGGYSSCPRQWRRHPWRARVISLLYYMLLRQPRGPLCRDPGKQPPRSTKPLICGVSKLSRELFPYSIIHTFARLYFQRLPV